MKGFAFVLLSSFLVLMALMGCSEKSKQGTTMSSSASWAYPFVRVNGETYGLSNKEIDKTEIGEKLGVVRRNVEQMDHGRDNYVSRNWDSNELERGTPLFNSLKDPQAIVYEKNGHFFLAKRIKQP
jgi:hypothetical protein